MLNILFSDSAGGSAKFMGLSGDLDLDTNRIACVELALNIGNIDKPFSLTSRRELYESFFEGFSKEPIRQIRKLNRMMKGEKEICIWYSKQDIDEYLGMLATVDRYKDKGIDIYLCDFTNICSSLRYVSNIGKFEPPPKKHLTKDECKAFVREWETIRDNSSHLRMMIDGEVKCFPEDHLDSDILEVMGDEEITPPVVYQRLFDKYPLFYNIILYRLRHLIEEGAITVIEEGFAEYRDEYEEGIEPYFPKTVLKRTI